MTGSAPLSSLIFACTALALGACEGDPLPPLEPSYGGCSSVWAGPGCGLEGAGSLVIAAEDAAPPLEVTVEGKLTPCEAGDEGQGCTVAIPEGATRLEVLDAEGRRGGLDLAIAPPPEALQRARELYKADEYQQAWDLLEAALPQAEPAERASYTSFMAFCALAQGDPERAIETLREGLATVDDSGDQFRRADMANILVMLLLQGSRPEEARAAVMESVPTGLSGSLDIRYVLAWQRGMLARYLGDHREATRAFEEAGRVARIGGRSRWFFAAASQLSDIQSRSGLYEEALRSAQRSIDEMGRDVDRSKQLEGSKRLDESLALMNYAWVLLMARDAGDDPAGWNNAPALGLDAHSVLDQAWAKNAPDAPGGAAHSANLLVNRALAALQQEDYQASAALLRQARETTPELQASFERWAWFIEGRLGLARSQGEAALQAFRNMERWAVRGNALEEEWRARHGQALALELLGRPEEALASYDRGQAQFLEQSFLVPLHLGRDALLDQHEQVTRDHVTLLLRMERQDEAFQLVRHHRAVFLAGLRPSAWGSGLASDGRAKLAGIREEYRSLRASAEGDRDEDWERSVDAMQAVQGQREALTARALELVDRGGTLQAIRWPRRLRDPAPGELLLSAFPMETGWVGFAQRTGELRTTHVEEPEALLAPFEDWIREADLVTLLPVGTLRDQDLHGWDLNGEPLATQKAVAYGMDIAATPTGIPAGPPDRALVVADPDGSLELAREEGHAVADALGQLGSEVEHLEGQTAVRERVIEALGDVTLLHYAGHAEALDDAWDSHVRLAHAARLTTADVVAASAVPPLVYLSACETAAAQPSGVETLGLAQAFTTAGARAVVATRRPLRDDVGLAFATAFYGALPDGNSARAYQQALQALASSHPESDWRSIVLLRP